MPRAEPLYLDTIEVARQKLGLAHPTTQSYIQNLTGFYQQVGQPAKAEPFHRELADFAKKHAGADSPQYARQLAGLGS